MESLKFWNFSRFHPFMNEWMIWYIRQDKHYNICEWQPTRSGLYLLWHLLGLFLPFFVNDLMTFAPNIWEHSKGFNQSSHPRFHKFLSMCKCINIVSLQTCYRTGDILQHTECWDCHSENRCCYKGRKKKHVTYSFCPRDSGPMVLHFAHR